MPNFIGRRVPTSSIVAQAPQPYTTPPMGMSGSRNAAPVGDLAQAISGLGSTFANGAQTALRNEQLTKLSDANQLTRMAAQSIGQDGIIIDPQGASIAASLGVLSPENYGRLQAIQAATSGDLNKATPFLTGLGQYKNTPEYARNEFANQVAMQGMQEATKLRIADKEAQNKLLIEDNRLTPIVDSNDPSRVVYARNSAAVGQRPIMSMDQTKAGVLSNLIPTLNTNELKTVAGANENPGEFGNASIGGRTIPAYMRPDGIYAAGGGKLEGVDSFGKLTAATTEGLSGNNGVGKDILEGRINTERAVTMVDSLTTELNKPNSGVSVGFLGSLSEVANNIRSQVESGVKAAGGLSAQEELRGNDPRAQEVKNTVDRIMQENQGRFSALQQQGIDTARVRALIEDLAYAQAKANDPSGRVSNQDVERAGRQVGLGLGDPIAMKQVLADLRERTISGQEIRERNSAAFLKNGQTLPTWNSPILQNRPNRAVSTPAAPSQNTGEVVRWIRGADGKVQRAQ